MTLRVGIYEYPREERLNNMNGMHNTEFTVPEMSCAHCKAAIEDSLNRLPGIGAATTDPETKQVEVSFDEDRVNLDQLKLAIENAGYTVEDRG